MIQTDLLPYLPSLMLHFVRAGAFFVAIQLFGSQNESKTFRLILAISLGATFWWVDDDKLMHDIAGGSSGLELLRTGGFLSLGLLVALDSLVGLAAGFAVSMIVHAMAIAGEILNHDMGFAMAQVMDPITGRSHAVMSQFFQTIVILMVFGLNFHHGIIRVLARTYELIPVGQGFNIEPVFHRLNDLISFSISSALRYAFPVMGILVLLTAVLVMLARAVQNINLMEFSFGLRIVLGIFSAIFFLGEGMPFLQLLIETILVAAADLFEGAN